MSHAVALVPGFLGFDHQGELTYFADRFLAGLRSAIESAARQSVRVVPIRVPPIGSLAERQEALIGALTNLDSRSGGPFSWHLVGHTTQHGRARCGAPRAHDEARLRRRQRQHLLDGEARD